MLCLAVDFETTGLPMGRALDHPSYPRIVEAGAVMFDDATGEPVSALHMFVRPDDWSISSGAHLVHGISERHAARAGVDEILVLVAISRLAGCCEAVVTYSSFDRDVVTSGLIRNQRPTSTWNRPRLRHIDLQAISTPVVDERFEDGGQKWPPLSSAMEFILGSAHDGAHTALGDAVAAMRLFIALRDRGLVTDMGNRAAAKKAHPDAGGNDDLMAAVNAAKVEGMRR